MLPQQVLRAMWTQWFNMQAELYPNNPGAWLQHSRDFSAHDVMFQFADSRGTIFNLRCNASEFLTSPWAFPGQPGATMACFVQAKHETGVDLFDQPWILGVVSLNCSWVYLRSPPMRIPSLQNFFWAAMLRLNATHRGEKPILGQSTPFVQLAPQRIVRNGRKVAGPWDLEIHADLPPHMQAMLREQPELRA